MKNPRCPGRDRPPAAWDKAMNTRSSRMSSHEQNVDVLRSRLSPETGLNGRWIPSHDHGASQASILPSLGASAGIAAGLERRTAKQAAR